ncbi:MAG: S24 family peptidase [Clostridiales bacterium]|nr:S24 family peptidase [Clostridiales bacterium]
MGRNFQRVDTITLQFSKSEWEDILAYQKMNPGKNLAELAEEFILKLTDDIENEAKYKDDDYALPVIGNIVADRFMAGDTIPWKVKPRKNYPSDYFGLRVYGNSMEPLVSNDQIAVIRPWDDPDMPDVGDIVVYSDGRGVMLKQLALRDGKYVLSSLNPLYKDITPIDGEGRITGIYVDKLDDFRKA